jgi:hypothetical protein
MKKSRFRHCRPAAALSHMGSMKSGPFLKGCISNPLRRNAAQRPVATVLLPELRWGAEMTIRGAACPPRPERVFFMISWEDVPAAGPANGGGSLGGLRP